MLYDRLGVEKTFSFCLKKIQGQYNGSLVFARVPDREHVNWGIRLGKTGKRVCVNFFSTTGACLS